MNVKKFNEYEGFVDKFKPKKTTDDCYTPPAVYQESAAEESSFMLTAKI